MFIDRVQQGDDWIVGVGSLNLVGMPLVKAKLAVSGCIVRMVLGTLVLLVFHKEQVPIQNI